MNLLQKYYLIGLAIIGSLSACSEEEDAQTVYFSQGDKTISKVFSITEEPYILKFTASLTGADFSSVSSIAKNDINIKFAVDTSLVRAYNEACGTNYLPMPEGTYQVPGGAVIGSGKSTTDSLSITITAKDKFESFVPYLLPVTIREVNGASAHNYQQTIYIALSGIADAENIQLYDRSEWKIAGFSTEEPGEGGGNGLAARAIDGEPGTYWHSKWSGGEPEPPHFITIDMGESKVVHGIALMNRNFSGDWATTGHGQPKTVKIALSQDGENWINAGDFSNLPHPEGQPFNKFFFNVYNEARFIRVTVTAVYATSSTSIAEFGVF